MEMLSKDRWKITEIINLEKNLYSGVKGLCPFGANPSLGDKSPRDAYPEY